MKFMHYLRQALKLFDMVLVKVLVPLGFVTFAFFALWSLYKNQWETTAVLIGLALSILLSGYIQRKGNEYLQEIQARTIEMSRSLIIADRYFIERSKYTLYGIIVLGLSAGYCFFMGDVASAIAIGGLLFAVFVYAAMTWIRCACGWFGDNALEVQELLEFVISKARDGGIPPGSKATRAAMGEVIARPADNRGVAEAAP
jgi:hypothetical protein